MRVLWGDVGVSIGMDAKKDLPVDMGEYFPYLGVLAGRRHSWFCPYDRDAGAFGVPAHCQVCGWGVMHDAGGGLGIC